MTARLIVAAWSLTLVVVTFTSAAEHPTAAQLLQEGVTQLEQGRLDEARATLGRVDSVQLDKPQQQRLSAAKKLAEADALATLALADPIQSSDSDAAAQTPAAKPAEIPEKSAENQPKADAPAADAAPAAPAVEAPS